MAEKYNWLDARKEFGTVVTDSIFPKIPRKKTDDEAADESQAADGAG
ncbi:MAG: hypothetical protein LBU39_09515 [Desulfobulbaceae bacterium]|nr:hypothetical protein [Desulfobulbaceae bacterium]